MDNFCHLHVHSTYSFLDGLGTPEQYMKRCKEIGQPALALTDHGNTSGHYKWFKQAQKNGIKPILGCELYVTAVDKTSTKRYNHMTVLAKNNIGYKNLLNLVTTSWDENHFNYRPQIKLEEIYEKREGLIVTSGCPAGIVPKLIENKNVTLANYYIEQMKEKFGDDFYIEIAPWKNDGGKYLIMELSKLSKKFSIPMVAAMDTHYVTKDQNKLHEMLLAIQTNDTMDNPKRWVFNQDDFYLKTRKEMEESFDSVYPNFNPAEALNNTLKIAEKIDFTFPKANQLKIKGNAKDKIKELEKICRAGMEDKGLAGKKEYEDRLRYELDLIEKKDFIDYFLIVIDMVLWAKNHNILVGPARGSAAGSLVCFASKITEVDPIKFGLIFERFIDINREDLPDIDVDFEDEKRALIKEHLYEKYGIKHTSNVATFSVFKGRSCIDDIGRINKIPFKDLEQLKGLIIERSGGDSRAAFTIEDTFNQFDKAKEILSIYPALKYAKDLEGQVRHVSTHASGFVMSSDDIEDFCSIYTIKGQRTTSLDYYDLSDIGLTKFDILGIQTLTAVKKALDLIKERTGKEINIYTIDLEDKKVLSGFRDPKKLFGIFQFDGSSVNQVCRQMQPDNFEQLSAINALSRPGPLHGTDPDINKPITSIYIDRRHGKIPVIYAHPLLEPITKDSYGLVIYQEQVMKTMREVGKMSWKDTANIRKAISKSQGLEAFNKYREVFSVGAKENGLDDREIDKIWSSICTFGCLSGNTILKLPQSNQYSPKEITIRQLFCNGGVAKIAKNKGNRYAQKNRKIKLLMAKKDSIKTGRVVDVYQSGVKTTYEIKLENGNSIRATEEHKFLTKYGWKKLSNVKIGELLAIDGGKFSENKGIGSGYINRWNGDGQSKLFLERQKFLRKTIKYCQVCKKNKNEETHHKDGNRKNNKWSNLVPICKKCHKKTYTTSIPFTKGRKISFCKIVSIGKPRKEMTYDIAMPYPWNNYVANGFVVHNSWAFNKSHSVSYTIISYWTMFLKVYYPIEYYAAMASTNSKEEKIRKIIKEYLREGNELMPISINLSKESFTIEDNKLRIGFSQIKGFGDKAVDKIIKNQPYSNFKDFINKTKLGDSYVKLLAKIGAFKWIGGAQIKENTIFGMQVMKEYQEETNLSERIKICPLSLELKIEDEWKEFLDRVIKYPVTQIEKITETRDEALIIGIAYDMNLKNKIEEAVSKGKPIPELRQGEQPVFLNFILEDDSDFVLTRVSTFAYPIFGKLILEESNDGDVFLCKGRMGDGIRMFFANEIINLTQLKDKLSRRAVKELTQSEKYLMGLSKKSSWQIKKSN